MKAIIWGHKLHSHTSSYVHYGFFRAFRSLNYDTFWFDDKDDVSNINFDNSIFLTEGQVDRNIPMNNSSKYILHNCEENKYKEIKNKINIQFFHNSTTLEYCQGQHKTFCTKTPLTKINNYTYVCDHTIYQPWATDLLPNEINLNDAHNELQNKECVWVGSYNPDDHSEFQNNTELDPFFNECKKNNISVKIINPWSAPISPEDNRLMINKSFLAPAIQSPWQVTYGYAPNCRLLKNISYGHSGITNSETANNLFDNKLIFDKNPINLFYKCIEKKNDPNLIDEIKFLMNEVKEKHTYINRVQQILSLI